MLRVQKSCKVELKLGSWGFLYFSFIFFEKEAYYMFI